MGGLLGADVVIYKVVIVFNPSVDDEPDIVSRNFNIVLLGLLDALHTDFGGHLLRNLVIKDKAREVVHQQIDIVFHSIEAFNNCNVGMPDLVWAVGPDPGFIFWFHWHPWPVPSQLCDVIVPGS